MGNRNLLSGAGDLVWKSVGVFQSGFEWLDRKTNLIHLSVQESEEEKMAFNGPFSSESVVLANLVLKYHPQIHPLQCKVMDVEKMKRF